MKKFVIFLLMSAFLFTACETLPAKTTAENTFAIPGPTVQTAMTPQDTKGPVQTPGENNTLEPVSVFDPELTVLVNFEHPRSTESPMVLIAENLTADNVFCDERRHADGRAVKALDEMLLAAREEGDFHFIIASAFRSTWEQQILWDAAIAQDPDYGRDPHTEPVGTMPPHCSEHITGLAFDILCDECRTGNPAFTGTPEGRWLAANAHRFGFILRYPADKQLVTGVKYEPWHYRYVGKEAAEYMYSHNLCLEEFADIVG